MGLETGLLQLVLGIPIVLGNGIVLYILLKHIHIKTHGCFLMVNLTSADILVGLTLILQATSNLNDEFLSWSGVCAFRFSSMIFVSFSSLFAVFLTTLERFFCVCYHGYDNVMSNRRTIAIAFCFWMYALILTIWPIAADEYRETSENLDCWPSRGYLAFIPLQYFLLLLGMCAMYVKMCLIAIRKKRQIISVEANLVLNSRLLKFQHEVRGAKFMAVILVVFMFFWTPFAICLVIQAATEEVNFDVMKASAITAFFGVVNSLVNPVLYPLQNRKFRSASHQIFGRIKRQFTTQRDTTSTVV